MSDKPTLREELEELARKWDEGFQKEWGDRAMSGHAMAIRYLLSRHPTDETRELVEALEAARDYLPSQSALPRGKTRMGDVVMQVDAALAAWRKEQGG